MSSVLQQLGITTNSTTVQTAIAALGPLANDAFIDYTILIAALTTTLIMLILVVFLTDVQRQYTVVYWSTLIFLVTACCHFTLLSASYRAVFFGYKDTMTIIVLQSIFAAFSRTVADWIMMLRVWREYGRVWWLLSIGLGIILMRLSLELIGRIVWNVQAVEVSAIAYVVGYNSRNIFVKLYPAFIALTDVYFSSIFFFHFSTELKKQRDLDKEMGIDSKRKQAKNAYYVFLKEHNLLPAITSCILAIVQIFSVDPNRYGALHLWIVAVHIPFASVWQALHKLNHNPSEILFPAAAKLVGVDPGLVTGKTNPNSQNHAPPNQLEAQKSRSSLNLILATAEELIKEDQHPPQQQTQSTHPPPDNTNTKNDTSIFKSLLEASAKTKDISSKDPGETVVPIPEGTSSRSLFDKVNNAAGGPSTTETTVDRSIGDEGDGGQSLAEIISGKVNKLNLSEETKNTGKKVLIETAVRAIGSTASASKQ